MPTALTEPKNTDNEITRLRKERYRCARDEAKAWADGMQNGMLHVPSEEMFKCITTRLLEAELALCQTPGDRVVAYTRVLPYAKAAEAINEVRFNSGRIPIQDLKKAQFVRLDIEIKLLEAKDEETNARRK